MDSKLWKKILNENTLVTEGVSSQVFKSYLDVILWAGTDDDDEQLSKNYDHRNFDKSALNQAKKDLNKFFGLAQKYIQDEDEKQVAHDFWLTRNRHGTGFWDRDYKYGKELTKLAQKFGDLWAYVGDDGKIYF